MFQNKSASLTMNLKDNVCRKVLTTTERFMRKLFFITFFAFYELHEKKAKLACTKKQSIPARDREALYEE